MLEINFAVFLDREEEKIEKSHPNGIRRVGQLVKDRVYPLRNIIPGRVKFVLGKIAKTNSDNIHNEPVQDGVSVDKFDADEVIEAAFCEKGVPDSFRINPSVKYIYIDEIPDGYEVYKDKRSAPASGEVYVSVSYKPDYYFPLSVFEEQVEAIEKEIILDMLKGIGARKVRVQKCDPFGGEQSEGSPAEEYSFGRPSEFHESRQPLIADHKVLSDFQYKNYNNNAPKTDVLTWSETDFGILDDIANGLRKQRKKDCQSQYCIGALHVYHFYVDSFFDKLISEQWIEEKSSAVLLYCTRFIERSLITTSCFIGGVVALLGSGSREVLVFVSAALFAASYSFLILGSVKFAVSLIRSKIKKIRGETREPVYQKIKRFAKIVEHVCTEREEDKDSAIVVSCEKLAHKSVVLGVLIVVIFVMLFVLRGWTAKHFYNCTAWKILYMPFKTVLSYLQ